MSYAHAGPLYDNRRPYTRGRPNARALRTHARMPTRGPTKIYQNPKVNNDNGDNDNKII